MLIGRQANTGAVRLVENPADPEVNAEREIIVKALSLIAEEKLTATERARIMDKKEFLRLTRRADNESAREERQRTAAE